MKTLIESLLLFDRLTEQQISLISDIIKEVHLQVGEYFAEPGNICSQLAFVEKGVLRYNHYNSGAENITTGLIGEGNFVPGTTALHLQVIASDYLQAITQCTLSVIEKRGLDELSLTISTWDNILKKISQKAISEKSSRILQSKEDRDPMVAAAEYLDKFPNLARYLDVYQMALYTNAQDKDAK